MAIQKKTVGYTVEGVAFESLAVWDDATSGARPAVLVTPTFFGRSAFEEGKAELLATHGYVGLAVDIFGVDTRPATVEEASVAMTALNADRRLLAARMLAALDAVRGLDVVDAGRTAAIGYCFGGKCVLDLARTGVEVKGVAAFHGLFDAPGFETAAVIPAKVLALHGWDDPLVKPEAVLALATELTDKKADWQIHAYGHAVHGFTRPNDSGYDLNADRRSWTAARDFLEELFG